jgi:hypothetical protein
LVDGLGRGGPDRPGGIVRPELSAGQLVLGAPLPEAAVRIGGYTIGGRNVWLVKVADATEDPGDPTHLQHEEIVTTRVARLRVFDESGRRILAGVPKIIETPSEQTRH